MFIRFVYMYSNKYKYLFLCREVKKVITIKNLKKVWDDDVTVLRNINLEIEEGDIYGLVGRSGAGKSTLLRCINGLTSYQEGNLTVDGHEVKALNFNELRKFRRNIGMIFQQFSLLERKTVYQNIALPMKCWNYSKDEIDKRTKELLELVGLSDKINERPRNLSGGQKQRVAIARALTLEPNILLCDEATSALDPKTTTSILDLLAEINQKIGITIIIVTHQMEVVRKVCNKISILEHGEIASQGEVKDIFVQQPSSLKRLLGVEEKVLPQSGRNIQIAHYVNDLKDAELFSKMAVELNIKFSIIAGQIQEYRDDMLSLWVINISDDQYSKVINYLNKKNFQWREILSEEAHNHELS